MCANSSQLPYTHRYDKKTDWLLASVNNNYLCLMLLSTSVQLTCPAAHGSWLLLNRLHTSQGQCRANLYQSCVNVGIKQSMNRVVETYLVVKFDVGLLALHEAEVNAVSQLKTVDKIRHRCSHLVVVYWRVFTVNAH